MTASGGNSPRSVHFWTVRRVTVHPMELSAPWGSCHTAKGSDDPFRVEQKRIALVHGLSNHDAYLVMRPRCEPRTTQVVPKEPARKKKKAEITNVSFL